MIHATRCLLAFTLALRLHAQVGGPDEVGPLVQPATYTSPSGEWQLSVDPTQRSGAGVGRYRMTRDGVEVWAGERPFTLFKAGIDDRGFVGGATCTTGDGTGGDFTFPIIDPSGSVVFCDESVPQRTDSCDVSGWHLLGVFVHGDADRFIVRVGKPLQLEHWRVHRLSTGDAIGRIELAEFTLGAQSRVENVLAVPGTPLTLVHSRRLDFFAASRDARFALVDENFHPVWICDWPGDYDAFRGENLELLFDELPRTMFTLPRTAPARFELRRFEDNQLVTFEARRDASSASGWSVVEVAHRPYAAPVVEGLPVVELRRLAVAPLGGPWLDEHWRKLVIGFDEQRRIGLIDTTTKLVDVFDSLGNLVFAKRTDTASFGYERPIGRRLTSFARGWHKPSEQANFLERAASDSSPALRIERRADGRFFRVVETAAVADDGKIAVLERPPYYELNGYAVSIYSPDGIALRTVELPFPSEPWPDFFEIDFVGDWISVSGLNCARAVVVRWRDGQPVVVPLLGPGADDRWNRCRLSPEARELLCVGYGDQAPVLHRYALPEK